MTEKESNNETKEMKIPDKVKCQETSSDRMVRTHIMKFENMNKKNTEKDIHMQKHSEKASMTSNKQTNNKNGKYDQSKITRTTKNTNTKITKTPKNQITQNTKITYQVWGVQ